LVGGAAVKARRLLLACSWHGDLALLATINLKQSRRQKASRSCGGSNWYGGRVLVRMSRRGATGNKWRSQAGASSVASRRGVSMTISSLEKIEGGTAVNNRESN